MPQAQHLISRDDIMPMERYGAERKALRAKVGALKRNRRVAVGPDATFYFESFDTMLMQVMEMLYIERGGEAQIADELAAYNPLVPKGRELVATLMFEIDDPARRARVLAGLGGVEHSATLAFAGHTVTALAEDDIDRTTAAGKASAVQFLHFPFSDEQVAAFRAPGTQVTIGLNHPDYGHMAVISEAVRQALAHDFD